MTYPELRDLVLDHLADIAFDSHLSNIDNIVFYGDALIGDTDETLIDALRAMELKLKLGLK